MWSREIALQQLALRLGAPRDTRRDPGTLERLYEDATPEFARSIIESISDAADARLGDYVRACIVVEQGPTFGQNLMAYTYQRDARAILYGRSLHFALVAVREAVRQMHDPALHFLGRKIAVEPKKVVPPDVLIDLMILRAREFLDSAIVQPDHLPALRAIKAFRENLISDETFEEVVSVSASQASFKTGAVSLAFGIAHELSHHLLGHGSSAKGDDRAPGNEVLAEWRNKIGWESEVQRSRPHWRELDADALALYLLAGERHDGDAGILIAGQASYCLLGLSVMEDHAARALNIPSLSHPTFRDRAIELMEQCFLGFDDAPDTPMVVRLDREVTPHPSSFVAQNVYLTQVVAGAIDRLSFANGGAAFGLSRLRRHH